MSFMLHIILTVVCCLKTGISEAEQMSIASQHFDNTHISGNAEKTLPGNGTITIISMATNRGGIVNCYATVLQARYCDNEEMNYSRGCSLLSWPQSYKKEATDSSSTVQFTPAHKKESRVQKTEVKIRLPGRAVQNTEIDDRVSSLCAVKL
jgi:hypothetical protein